MIMNTFMNGLVNETNFTKTENGALAHKTTGSAVYDLFATGGAYRNRTDEDCILLFKNALEEDETLALKCLFYLRDCRGGQGERRFFRVCMKWLANTRPEVAKRNISAISEFGRWDDLIYSFEGTKLDKDYLALIKTQLVLDIQCKTPSLLAKWMPSENASALETKRMAQHIRQYLGMSHKEYRKTLSVLRQRINVLERLMSENRWDEIEFDKIPSKAGLIYRNAFARRDIISKKYENFMKDENTKVNAGTLYPYEIVEKVLQNRFCWWVDNLNLSTTERNSLNKYWENQIDYLNGADPSMLCVIDTSGSMTGRPMNVAISLGLYCAERITGPFANHYISFSSKPQLIKTEGVDFVDKVERIWKTSLCDNTDIEKVFDLLLHTILKNNVNKEDIPKTITIISDMQIDCGSRWYSKDEVKTEMETIRMKWLSYGLTLPKLVYWNVDARGNANILDDGPNVSYVSGCSPVIFESVLTGKTGYDLMLEVLMKERYSVIK